MIKVKKTRLLRVRQGDVLKEVEYIEYVFEKSGIIEASKIIFPYVIVLSQDCDLDLDYKYRSKRFRGSDQDKQLISILVAPLYNAEHIYTGEHLKDIGLTMQTIPKSKTQGKNLQKNETPRYHYLEFPSDVPIVASVIDFKHYFSVNVKYLRKIKPKNFVCSVGELYRENIAQRFSMYLSRIGLPEVKAVPLGQPVIAPAPSGTSAPAPII